MSVAEGQMASGHEASQAPMVAATESATLQSQLEQIGMGCYAAALDELGVSSVEELIFVRDEELTAIGMKPVQIRKARQILGAPVTFAQPSKAHVAGSASQPVAAAPHGNLSPETHRPPANSDLSTFMDSEALSRPTSRLERMLQQEQDAETVLGLTEPSKNKTTKAKKKKKKKKTLAELTATEAESRQVHGVDEKDKIPVRYLQASEDFLLADFEDCRYNCRYWRDHGLPEVNGRPHFTSASRCHIYHDAGAKRWVLAEDVNGLSKQPWWHGVATLRTSEEVKVESAGAELPEASDRPALPTLFDAIAPAPKRKPPGQGLPTGSNVWRVKDSVAVWHDRQHNVKPASILAGKGGLKSRKTKGALWRAVVKMDILPSAAERRSYASQLGLQPESESDWRWLVEEAMSAPLPKGWLEKYEPRCRAMAYYNFAAEKEDERLPDKMKRCDWNHPLSHYYRSLVQQLQYFMAVSDSLRTNGEVMGADEMETRLDALCLSHEAELSALCQTEGSGRREVRKIRYASHFRGELERRFLQHSGGSGDFSYIFTGNSTQLATWRILEAQTSDELTAAEDRLVLQTERFLAKPWTAIHNMTTTQGQLLDMIAMAVRTHEKAARNIQKCTRGMPPRQLFRTRKAEIRRQKQLKLERQQALVTKLLKQWLHATAVRCIGQWRQWTSVRLLAKEKLLLMMGNRTHMYFQLWCGNMFYRRREGELLATARKMVIRMQTQFLVQCFDRWVTTMEQTRSAKALLLKLKHGNLLNYFLSWCDFVEGARESSKMFVRARKMVIRMQKQYFVKCFESWVSWTRQMCSTKNMVRKWKHEAVHDCFLAWCDFLDGAKQDARMLAMARKMVIRMQNQCAVNCFEKWSAWSRQMQSAERMLLILRQSIADDCFLAWFDFVADSQRQGQLLASNMASARKFVIMIQKQCFVKCFRKWAAWLRQIRSAKQLLLRLRYGCAHDCFLGWCDFVEDSHMHAAMLQMARKMVARMQKQCSVKCFRKWAAWLRQIRSAKQLLLRLRYGGVHDCFLGWSDFVESSHMHAAILQMARKMVVRMQKQCFVKCFRKWAAWLRQIQSAKQLLLRLRYGGAHDCFLGWRDFVESSHMHAAMLQMARKMVARMQKQCFVECVECWIRWVKQVRSAKKLLKQVVHGVAIDTFLSWSDFAYGAWQKRESLAVAREMARRMCDQRFVFCFDEWANLTELARRAKLAAGEPVIKC
jgi:hypothetical protein